ncbi:MAG TPA: Uma2 family endonuclease [Bryobacteraceae bacterium]
MQASGAWYQQKLELIDGELIDKARPKRPHVNALMSGMHRLADVFGPYYINLSAPVDVASQDNPTNEPEPDLIILNRPSGEFKSNPQPADITLLVEISDTSIRFDLNVKARLYARAAIAEYWVLDLNARRLIVHRDPDPAGYRSVVAYSELEKVAPQAASTSEILVSELIPA